MQDSRLPHSALLKLDLMFEGLRYSDALGEASDHAFPNFYPYRFRPGEPNPTGKDKVTIPYLMTLEDGTLIRLKGNPDSDWSVAGSQSQGYRLQSTSGQTHPIAFEPLPQWMAQKTADGSPMAQAGISLHGDMAVVNVAPGCEYFLERQAGGGSMRCSFCAYGAPNERVAHFNQQSGTSEVPEATLQRMQETLKAALLETEIRHIYLVGGSMADPAKEGERFIQIAQAVQEVNAHKISVSCGSGALPEEQLRELHRLNLVDQVCFNLEVWSEELFAKVCPGKNHFVGYKGWLDSLEMAVGLWGRGRVYSAMVAGIELEPEYGMSWESAADLAVRGADDLCSRGIVPIYSLYWPTGGRDHPEYFERLRSFFERLNVEYKAIRDREKLQISEDFMCHRCAYMQLECDVDRAWK